VCTFAVVRGWWCVGGGAACVHHAQLAPILSLPVQTKNKIYNTMQVNERNERMTRTNNFFNPNDPNNYMKMLVIAYPEFPNHGFLVYNRTTTGPAFCPTEWITGVDVDIFGGERLRLGVPRGCLCDLAAKMIVIGKLTDYKIINPEKFDEWAKSE